MKTKTLPNFLEHQLLNVDFFSGYGRFYVLSYNVDVDSTTWAGSVHGNDLMIFPLNGSEKTL